MSARDFIGKFEGCHRLVGGLVWPYVCPAGYWTQGWGRLVSNGAPAQSQAVVDRWFEEDIVKHQLLAFRHSPQLKAEPERRIVAITSFVYNLGGEKYAGSTLRRRVNERDWSGAQEEIVKWVFGGGKKLPGLVLRRSAEAALLR